MKPAMKPIGQCSAIEVLSMIGYKMRICHPRTKLGKLSIIVKSKAPAFCLMTDDSHSYQQYEAVDNKEPLCVAVRYATPMAALGIVARKLLSLVKFHADPSLGSDDVLLLKVDFSQAPECMTIQINNEEPHSYNVRSILLLF